MKQQPQEMADVLDLDHEAWRRRKVEILQRIADSWTRYVQARDPASRARLKAAAEALEAELKEVEELHQRLKSLQTGAELEAVAADPSLLKQQPRGLFSEAERKDMLDDLSRTMIAAWRGSHRPNPPHVPADYDERRTPDRPAVGPEMTVGGDPY